MIDTESFQTIAQKQQEWEEKENCARRELSEELQDVMVCRHEHHIFFQLKVFVSKNLLVAIDPGAHGNVEEWGVPKQVQGRLQNFVVVGSWSDAEVG